MVYRFREIYDMYVAQDADSIGMHKSHVVTLASIVQAEAVYDSEMPRISAVYHNRLRNGMRLEADPTVAYALGGVRRRLWLKDLRVNSPYNTYRNKGLPPGAICNPGQAALEAAVKPLNEEQRVLLRCRRYGKASFQQDIRRAPAGEAQDQIRSCAPAEIRRSNPGPARKRRSGTGRRPTHQTNLQKEITA